MTYGDASGCEGVVVDLPNREEEEEEKEEEEKEEEEGGMMRNKVIQITAAVKRLSLVGVLTHMT